MFGTVSLPSCNNQETSTKINSKNWLWFRPFSNISVDQRKRLLAKIKSVGIDAILPEVYNSWEARFVSKRLPSSSDWLEQLLPLAKEAGLEVHAWMWSMPCNIDQIHKDHPDWFAVNGKGESTVNKPAYVDYYKFMCPNREGVQNFVRGTVEELSQYSELDGIHLDYIRLPDVILAETLQPKYNIVQDREYPEYDYCYCDVCRSKFLESSGIDVSSLEDPSLNHEWRQFRYDSITNLVNNILIPTAKKYDKTVTAAVFPNWFHVRQQWSKWNLDGALPMLYHNFYNKGIEWIGEKTREEVAQLPKNRPLYSGLNVGALKPTQLIEAIEVSVKSGARGYSLFSADLMTDDHWASLEKYNNMTIE